MGGSATRTRGGARGRVRGAVFGRGGGVGGRGGVFVATRHSVVRKMELKRAIIGSWERIEKMEVINSGRVVKKGRGGCGEGSRVEKWVKVAKEEDLINQMPQIK